MKLYNLFEDIILEAVKNAELLMESVDFNTVRDSIENKYNVNIVYIDGDGVRTSRYIQPYVLGDTLAGNKAIRAYQIFGGSRTMVTKGEQAQGGWRIFRLDRIVDWKPTKMRFTVPVSDLPSFMMNRGRFNPNGDKMFNRIDVIAKFGGGQPMQEPVEVPIQRAKTDLSPKIPRIAKPTPKPNVKQNSYSTGKDPKPTVEPKKPVDTSRTTSVDTSKTTAQPINKDKQKQKV